MRLMETYDIIMLVVLVGTTLFGAIKGFAWQLASIASIVISYIVAYKYREPISESIQADPPWDRFLAMLILYIGTSLLIWVAFRMVRGSIDRMKLKEFDRQIGALFGLAKGALYCTLITLFAVTLSGERVREAVDTVFSSWQDKTSLIRFPLHPLAISFNFLVLVVFISLTESV